MNLQIAIAVVVAVCRGHGPDGYRDLAKTRPMRDGHLDGTITTAFVNYTLDDEVYEGYVAYPTSYSGELSAIIIVHQWYGLGENEMFRAEEAAEMGYVGWAIDMYGAGRRATNNDEAIVLVTEVRSDMDLQLARFDAGLDQLEEGGAIAAMVAINASSVVCNGYCFGGGVCLTYLTEVPADIVGASVFHTSYVNLTGFASTNTAVQIHHAQFDGAGDEGLLTAQAQLTDAGVPIWETAYYSNAFHGFSDILSDVYDERVATQSHASMFSFYDGILASCQDSTSWHKNGDPSKDCDWAADHPPRCGAVGTMDGVRTVALDACPLACGSCSSRRRRA